MNVSTSKFLTTLSITKFFDKKILRLSGDKLIGDVPERQLTPEEIEEVLIDKFGIYPRFYLDAKARLS